MATWFKVTVQREVMTSSGKMKKVSEQYLIDAVNFTEAEKRSTEELIEGDSHVVIKKIDPVKLSELFLNDKGDKYYKCKVNYITLDEKSGKEKKKPCYMYVQATSTENAQEVLSIGMKGTMADWECESVSETKILDIFKYDLEKKSQIIPKEAVNE